VLVGADLSPDAKREVAVTLEEATPEAVTALGEAERSVERCEGDEKRVNRVTVEDTVERRVNAAHEAIAEHGVACLKLGKRCPQGARQTPNGIGYRSTIGKIRPEVAVGGRFLDTRDRARYAYNRDASAGEGRLRYWKR
jgi:hypothetical protein